MAQESSFQFSQNMNFKQSCLFMKKITRALRIRSEAEARDFKSIICELFFDKG